MRYSKIAFFLIFNFLITLSYSQTDNNISIKLKDYHSSGISEAISTDNGKYFISADNSGKILVYNTEDYSYSKTLRKGSGIPIQSMRLVRHDSLLLFNQRYELGDGKTDSLIGVRLFDGKVVYKRNIKGSFIDEQEDIIIAKSKNQSLYILEVFDKNFKRITSAYANDDVEIAATTKDHFTVAYVENWFGRRQKVVVIDTKSANELINLSVPEKLPIIHLFFDNITDELFSVNVDTENKKVHIYNLSKQKGFVNPLFSEENPLSKFVNVDAFHTKNCYQITLSASGVIPYNPLIITKNKKNKFSSEIPQNKNGVSHCLYLESKDEYVFFEPFNTNFSSVNSFSIYDNNLKSIKQRHPKDPVKFYSGTFLPNNNWMVMGNELKQKLLTTYEHQIKYYDQGTFNNRFGKLDFSNYLEAKHDVIEFTKGVFDINEVTGIYPFHGYRKLGDYDKDYGFYTYDFLKDKVEKIAEENRNYTVILDYNNSKNLLLISKRLYSNDGHTEPQEFVLINNNKLNILKGKFKFGKLSNNGDFLLTINENNIAEIREVKSQKVVFNTNLINGKYKLFSIEDSGFVISNSFYELDMNKCNNESIIIEFDTVSSNYKSQEIDCVHITDVTYAQDNVAMIADGLGVIINNKTLQFHQSEFPVRISLNETGTKLMVSFNNGKISILDTGTLKELGVMLHPNKDTHAFIDSEGYFFSNVNSKDFFIAHKGNTKAALSEAEKLYFNPEKILDLFGTPNIQYLYTLKKALSIKAQREQTSAEIVEEKTTSNLTSPELYVLSIGVSEYEQSDYNLTFADKDAIDIAKIYGNLSKEEMLDYKTKFFGDVFTLFNDGKNSGKTINKYLEPYSNIGSLYPVNVDRTIYLEHNYGNIFLWDFNSQTIETIELPENIELSTYSFNQALFINPDNTGFYLKDENNHYYSYKFFTKTLSKISLPFKDPKNSPIPIYDNYWVNLTSMFNGTYNEGTLEIGKINEKVSKKVTFNLDVVTVFEDNKKTQDTIYGSLPTLKAISNNGNHLFYTADFNSLFFVDLTEETPIPLKISLEKPLEYNTEVFLSEDGTSFSLLNRFSDSYKRKIETYNLNGEILNTIEFKEDDILSFKGFSIYNNKPFWIQMSSPLVNEELFSSNDLLENNTPHSFKKTYVKHITNQEATSSNLKSALVDFTKNTKGNDQIIIFLAGHGVLDKDLSYYFAPHDMDFKYVSKKGLSLNTMIESLKKSNSKNILLLMDSCHSGSTIDMETSETEVVHNNGNSNERGSKSRKVSKTSEFKVSEIISTLFKDFLSTSGVTIISASSGEDVAYENKELGNGAFTSAFIKLLKKELIGGGYIMDEEDLQKPVNITSENIEELLKDVMIITKGKQVPDLRELNASSNLKMW
ncbi:caspase family protein [Seonamhaeicola maritimus]|uniref:caspase family protein n=1 Tax=Seonamhaeicola maritimus TaxID=2591822 RepID=UPI002494DD4A|nr:caspase family protein [Seonamhaeicola maritimus]